MLNFLSLHFLQLLVQSCHFDFSWWMWCSMIIDSQNMLNYSGVSGINALWSWWVMFLICRWILVAATLLGFFILSWSGTLVCSLLFIVEHLSGLVAKTILALQNDMEEFLWIYFWHNLFKHSITVEIQNWCEDSYPGLFSNGNAYFLHHYCLVHLPCFSLIRLWYIIYV